MNDEQPETRYVQGIKPALAVVSHELDEVGFCSLQTVTFARDGRPTVTQLTLEVEEAKALRDALNDLLRELDHDDGRRT